ISSPLPPGEGGPEGRARVVGFRRSRRPRLSWAGAIPEAQWPLPDAGAATLSRRVRGPIRPSRSASHPLFDKPADLAEAPLEVPVEVAIHPVGPIVIVLDPRVDGRRVDGLDGG